VINQSLASTATTSPLLQQRAANERERISDVAAVHASRYAVVGLQPVEPVGAERLAALAEAQPSGVIG
jgi:arsenite-transporting ATPase